jgi:hypothetical protein
MSTAELNTTLEDPASSQAADNHSPIRDQALVWSVVGVISVECLYALWTASRGYFWQDDFIDLQALRQLGFDGRLLEQPVFGHFIPGFNVVDYFISLIVPYPWWLVVLLEVFLFGLSLFLLDRLLKILFGRSWLSVALVALAGASFSLVPSLVWWATALEYLVAIPATLLACIFHVRYLRTGRNREAICGGVSIAVGFAFYDGLFVSVLFIVLMTLLIWPAGPDLHGVFQTLTAHRLAWLCYGLPVALELGWRFAHPGLYITGGSATLGQVLGFVGLSWTQTVIPLLFGVDAWLLPAHAERIVADLLGQALFVAFVVATILRRRSAWRAWVLIGSCVLFSAALVGATRAGTYGIGDASDVKYVALDSFLLVIAVGFALMPVRPYASYLKTAGVEPARSPSPRQTERPAWSPVLVVLTVLAVGAGYSTALVFDQNRDSESTGSRASHQFFMNFTASWARSAVAASHPFLWDTEINPRVVTTAFFPYDTASVTVGRLHPEIKFDQPRGVGYVLRPDGSVVRARTVTKATGFTIRQTACASPPHGSGRIKVTFDHRLSEATERFGLVSYRSARGAVATRSNGSPVVFPEGSGTLITVLPPAPLHSVVWTVQPPGSVCVTGFKVVVPVPFRRAPAQQSSVPLK